MPSISRRGWIGVAREATSGTAIATPTLFLPTKSTYKQQTKYAYVDEDRATRDINNARIATLQQSVGTTTGSWYNDASVYLLLAFMGADTASQPNVGTAPTVWSHALTLADVPPSLTMYRSFDFATYQMAYSTVNKLKFTFSAENKTLQCDASIDGQYGTKMGSPPTPTFSTLNPFSGLQATINIGGAQSNDILSMDIELTQKIELWYSMVGSQQFLTAYFADRSAIINAVARYDNDTYYNHFFNTPNTDDQMIITFTGPNIASTYNQSLSLTFPIVGYDDMDLMTDKSNVTLKLKGTARPGATKNSLFNATVQNTIASYTV